MRSLTLSVVEKLGIYSITLGVVTILAGVVGLFYAQQTSDRVNIVTTTFTAISIQFLVYDRLRNSVLGKLDFLNRKALSPALRVSRSNVQSASEDEASDLSKSRHMLDHHGEFLKIKLYPKGFLVLLSNAESAITDFRKIRDRIEEAGYKVWGRDRFNLWAVFVAAGLMEQGNYNNEMIGTHKGFFDSLKTSDPEAWEGFPRLGRKITELKAQIAKMVDDFFIDNQLEAYKGEGNPFEQQYPQFPRS